MHEWAEDNRLKRCPICGSRVGRSFIFFVLKAEMCEGCGRDEIKRWNTFVGEMNHDATES